MVFAIICRKKRMMEQKDSIKTVVRRICRRGRPIPSRLEGLVVRNLGSCLEVVSNVGMDDRDYPSKI